MGLPAFARPQLVSPHEYLSFEATGDEKHEYFDGHILSMAGASRNHSRVQKNLILLLETEFRKRALPYEALASDTRTQVSASRCFYPDVSVYCHEAKVDENDNFQNPSIVMEIISPSTEHFDRGEKSAAYRKMPSLRQIVIIDPAVLSVEVYDRHTDGWVLREAQGKLGEISVADVVCPLAEIFFNVEAAS